MNENITSIPELDSSLSFMMGLASKQFRTLANQALTSKFDITLEMVGALRVLAYLGEMPQQKLAETLHRERSVTKRLVDNCIKRGLIETYKSKTNKKARYLALTDKGLKVKGEVHQCLRQVIDDYYSPLTIHEQQIMMELCKKLVQDDILLGSD
ncbi:MarR family winged helix-turn-helix transcriptional regulator [Vibrio sp. F74]|uniref:MarR family winged helix-turn-helix transcriptional regulator n=1 Tax=Vibrio sp. F74 TaxID=700020 RepID=UPI0035F5B7E4